MKVSKKPKSKWSESDAFFDGSKMDEARRKVSKAKIAVTLLFVVIAIVAVSLVVESQVTQAPQLQLDDFHWVNHYGGDLPYVTVEGTVVNSRSVAAKNVTLVIVICAEGIGPLSAVEDL